VALGQRDLPAVDLHPHRQRLVPDRARLRPLELPDRGGINVEQGACSGNNSQWRLEPLADGSTRLVPRHSGKALDLAGCGLGDGVNIAQWTWLDNVCQRFYLRPV
jgi:hypothetical protein